MADIGHKKTDDIIDELEKKIRKEYEQANKEVQQKVDNYFARFKVKDAKKQAEVTAGTLSQKDYEEWRYGQMCVGERWKDLKDQLAKDYVNVNNIARSTAEGYAPEVYALNHNFAAYQVQHDAKMDISWTLYNREAVEYLMRDDPQLLPFLGTHSPTAEKLRERMDLLWNRQHVNSAITQGILQGESIPQISKRLQRVTDMNKAAATRNARTMMTSAENKGRQDAYDRLRDKGIDLQEMWMATLDGRTRHSHRALHGTYKDPKSGEYANGLRYPGDPMGEPEEIYNCRCCEIAEVEGVKVGAPNYSPKMDGMSFDEWLNGGSGHPMWMQEQQITEYLPDTDGVMAGVQKLQDTSFGNILKGCNPNYDADKYEMATHENCAFTSTAFEVRCRGYDVSAKEAYRGNPIRSFWYRKTGSGQTAKYTLTRGKGSFTDSFEGVEFEYVGAKRKANALEKTTEKMLEYGDGARAIVHVDWSTGGGHYFNAVCENGSVRYFDGQSGNEGSDILYYFESAKPSSIKLFRVDECELTDYVKEVVNVKKV